MPRRVDCKWSSYLGSSSDGGIIERWSRSIVIVKPVVNFNVNRSVNGHLGSSSDGRILECGSRFTSFTINASIKIKVHHRLNYDYGSQPAFYNLAIRI